MPYMPHENLSDRLSELNKIHATETKKMVSSIRLIKRRFIKKQSDVKT